MGQRWGKYFSGVPMPKPMPDASIGAPSGLWVVPEVPFQVLLLFGFPSGPKVCPARALRSNIPSLAQPSVFVVVPTLPDFWKEW